MGLSGGNGKDKAESLPYVLVPHQLFMARVDLDMLAAHLNQKPRDGDEMLTAADRATYVALCLHANAAGECHPNYMTVAVEAGISARSARRSVLRLLCAGLVTYRRGRYSNLYTIPHYKAVREWLAAKRQSGQYVHSGEVL